MSRQEQIHTRPHRTRQREGETVPTFPAEYRGKQATGGGDKTDEVLLDITEVLTQHEQARHLGHLGVEASK